MTSVGDSRASGSEIESVTDGLSRMMDDEAVGFSEANAAARVRAALLGETAPIMSLSRYRIRHRLGSGAMGEVWRAFDPDLSRDVAIKLVRPGRVDLDDTDRLLREARALAKLSHPNVVAVFDVGEHRLAPTGARVVYIVMELVEGETLSQWLAMRPRPWRSIVEVFVQAAAGLTAAHGVGLVHRDFKPANVFVGRDGRVRVGDFGLARRVRPSEVSVGSSDRDVAIDREVDITAVDRITQTGAVAGTPLYMAPEQHLGEAPTPAADQFALCVSLYEALCRKAPFPPRASQLLRAKLDGKLEPGRKVRCPSAVLDIVMRGLSPAIADRWPSVAALSRALENAARPRRWPVAVAALSVVALGSLAAGGSGASARCMVDHDDVWTADARAAVADTLALELDPPEVAAVVARLDARANAIAKANAGVCGELGLDRGCVRLTSAQLASTVARLAGGDRSLARHAIALVESLPDPSSCSDRDVGPKEAAPLATWDDLAHARVLVDAGRAAEALVAIDAALTDIEALGVSAARARCLLTYERAETLFELGDLAGSAAAYERAFFEAVELGDAYTAASAAAGLVMYYGRTAAREAATWRRHAETWTPRVRAAPPERASLGLSIAIGLAHIGDHDGAIAQFEAVEALCAGGVCPAIALNARDGIAETLIADGRIAEAAEIRAELLARAEADVGPHSRRAARARIRHAEVVILSSPREALALVADAMPVFEADPSPTRALAEAYLIAAQAYSVLGEGDAAVTAARNALQLVASRATTGDQSVFAYRGALANALEATGDLTGALAEFDAILEAEPAEPAMVAEVLINRGYIRGLANDPQGAVADALAARDILATVANPRPDVLITAAANRAWAHFNAGECEPGLEALEQAGRLVEEAGDVRRRAAFELDAIGGLIDCGRPDVAREELAEVPLPEAGTISAAWMTYYRARLDPTAVRDDELADARRIAAGVADRALIGRLDDLSASGRQQGAAVAQRRSIRDHHE